MIPLYTTTKRKQLRNDARKRNAQVNMEEMKI